MVCPIPYGDHKKRINTKKYNTLILHQPPHVTMYTTERIYCVTKMKGATDDDDDDDDDNINKWLK